MADSAWWSFGDLAGPFTGTSRSGQEGYASMEVESGDVGGDKGWGHNFLQETGTGIVCLQILLALSCL